MYRENDKLLNSAPHPDSSGRHFRAVGVEIAGYAGTTTGERHSHRDAELLYAEAGVVRIATADATWVLPPHRAAWFPSGCEHQADILGAAQVCRVFIDASCCPHRAPRTPCLLPVSPLLRELARRASELSTEYEPESRDGRLMALLLDEIHWTPTREMAMPRLRDPRLVMIEQAFAANAGNPRTLAQWANFAGASVRNLARLFEREAGMTFRQWREQFRVLAAIPRLVSGDPVTAVSNDLGYETPGAFTAMFRRITGVAPSHYRAPARVK